MSLRNAFKNFRRDSPSGEAVCGPPKRLRIAEEDLTADEITEDEYASAIEEIKEEYQKGKDKNQSKLKQLMEKTQNHRMMWIKKERPMITDVIGIFPCLATSKGVSISFVTLLPTSSSVGTLKRIPSFLCVLSRQSCWSPTLQKM